MSLNSVQYVINYDVRLNMFLTNVCPQNAWKDSLEQIIIVANLTVQPYRDFVTLLNYTSLLNTRKQCCAT